MPTDRTHQNHPSIPDKAFLVAMANKTSSMSPLLEIKQFAAVCKKKHSKLPCFPTIDLRPMQTLGQAIRVCSEDPEHSLLLAWNFSSAEIRAELKHLDPTQSVKIILEPSPNTERYHQETASLLEEQTLTRLRSAKYGLRKAVLKRTAKNLGQMRIIATQPELSRYFKLRFEVWNAMGYIPENSALLQEKWEIDRFDRFSIPIGLFDSDKDLIACARLVQAFGKERAQQINAIKQCLDNAGKPAAADAFSLTGKVEQPFDILCEFKGFWEYYRTFVKENIDVAEVSRIIVTPSKRGLGLAEALVDSLISVAKVQDIDVLLLACRESLQALYQKCGFKAVPNLVSGQFLNIRERSVVMKRTL